MPDKSNSRLRQGKGRFCAETILQKRRFLYSGAECPKQDGCGLFKLGKNSFELHQAVVESIQLFPGQYA